MLSAADILRRVLIPFLVITATLLAGLLVALVVQRAVRVLRLKRRTQLENRYRPMIDHVLRGTGTLNRSTGLPRVRRRHRRIVARLLVEPLRVLSGEPVDRAREVAHILGLTPIWMRHLTTRRWWRRAEAALALGFVREGAAYDALIRMLGDPEEEVRAAAAEALGRLADLRAVPALLARLSDQSRHQRARIIDAVSMLGSGGTQDLLAHARLLPDQLPILGDLIATVAGSAAVPDLLEWASVPSPEIRAAALRALGTVGIESRSFYYALRALGDADEGVRAMAARALGRSGRPDAAAYLVAHLEDTWIVAEESARALAAIGGPGTTALQQQSSKDGKVGDLARQMLWEQRAVAR